MLSKYSFGTYRTTYQNPVHKDALNYALDNGITNIDTSSNYMHGEAEKLIAQVLKNRNRSDFTIVSKGGYIQGVNLKRVKEFQEVEDLVIYDEHCYHSIHPDFLSDQIERSLQRLESDYIDVYLLHNPEYYLMKEIKKDTHYNEIIKFQKIMQERIKKAFVLLEEKVKEGKIRAYGISSNSFSKSYDDIHFLEYKHLIDYAKEIAGEKHNLKVIQLPMNLYELQGEKTAIWAHKNGLEIHINRPLNSFKGDKMIRLASYEKDEKYEILLREIKEVPNQALQDLINQIINIEDEYRWAGDVDDIIEYQVIPYLVKNVNLDPKYFTIFNKFIESYKSNIKHKISTEISKELYIPEPMDKSALKFLEEKEYVTRILVGMRQKKYIDKIFTYNK